jgi:PST family polysaccharide transporter
MLGIVTGTGIVVSLVIYLFRNAIVLTLYGNAYEGTAAALSILSLAILCEYMVAGLGTAYVSAGHEKLAFLSGLAGAVTNVALNVILIPEFGYMGAAFATVISYAIIIVLRLAAIGRLLTAPSTGVVR